jgi:hypothetical protein
MQIRTKLAVAVGMVMVAVSQARAFEPPDFPRPIPCPIPLPAPNPMPRPYPVPGPIPMPVPHRVYDQVSYDGNDGGCVPIRGGKVIRPVPPVPPHQINA